MGLRKKIGNGNGVRKVCKNSAIGVNSNTPHYLLRLEVGLRRLEVEARRRARNYICRIVIMEDDRCP